MDQISKHIKIMFFYNQKDNYGKDKKNELKLEVSV